MTRIGHFFAKFAVAAIVLGSDVSAICAQIPDQLRRAAENGDRVAIDSLAAQRRTTTDPNAPLAEPILPGVQDVLLKDRTAAAQDPPNAGSNPTETKSAACAWTMEQFIAELDAVMMENPSSILRYDALLAKYLFLTNGVPGLPPPLPGASVDGCIIDQVIEIAKRSKFFYDADGPPHYEHYRIELRSVAAKVVFSVEKRSGNIIGPYATWIKVYP